MKISNFSTEYGDLLGGDLAVAADYLTGHQATLVLDLVNQSGAARTRGDLVIVDTANNEAFTTSTSSNTLVPIGVVDDSTIAAGSNGRVVVGGYARAVSTLGISARGDYLYHSTTATKAAHMAGSPPSPGAFGYVLAGGSNANTIAHIFPTEVATGGGGGTLTVTEEDGSPSVTADTIKFPNGSVTDLGSGDVLVRQVPTGFIGARAYNSAAVSVATGGSGTIITLDSERFDSDAYHSVSANTGRMTVPAGMGGKHLLSGTVRFASSALGERRLELLLNGTTVIAAQSEQGVIASAVSVQVGTVYDLAAGDYVEMRAYQDSGGALNVEAAGNFTPEFVVAKLDSGRVGSGVGASAYNSTTQTVATTTPTNAALDTELFDTDGFHNNVTNNSRMTIPAGLGGKYLVVGGGRFSTANRCALWLTKNGTAVTGSETEGGGAIGLNNQRLVHVLELAAGDYVELTVYQESGSNQSFGQAGAGEAAGYLSIMRLDSPAAGPLASNVASRTAGDITTTSTTFVDATDLTVTITTGARRCLVTFIGNAKNSGANITAFDLAIDGTRVGQATGLTFRDAFAADISVPVGFTHISDVLSAGSHTFKVQWRVTAGTGTLWASAGVTPAILRVVELAS